ncbi:MAG: type IV secretory system conjugative DNA transfer family protein, partial [Phycisphaerales bacterium]|nr:type IV secretory system conjugative DNA transfer family protein [Phycisphaerales bacterium]
VDPKYLAYIDPLAGLDPNDGEFATWARRIATALIKIPEGTESEQWAKRAARLIAVVIMHVMTSDNIADDERTLMTVLRLIRQGRADLADKLTEKFKAANQKAKAAGKEPTHNLKDIPHPLELLAQEMIENRACRGHISEEAQNILLQVKSSSSYFESIRSEAADQLSWLQSHNIERSLTGIKDFDKNGNPTMLPPDRRLDPDRLKTDPKGISVFIVMKVEDLGTYEPWLQTVFLGLFAAMRKTKTQPKTGHQVLTVLDEFTSLGYQDYIATTLDSIAGSGMKLMIVVQNYGRLKHFYKEGMESFFTNSGLEIYFGKIGDTATDYLQKELGQTEVVKVARSTSQSETTTEGTGKSIAFGQSSSEGGSDADTLGHSIGKSWNWSKSVNLTDSQNWGASDGQSMGRNYGPHVFMQPLAGGTNYNRNFSRNTGGSHTQSRSKTTGGGKTETHTSSKTKTSSWNNQTSETNTYSTNTSKGYQIGGGMAETFHKKPLLEPHEMNTYLQPFAEADRDNPVYPGFALIRIEGENPIFLRRSNYDQDIVFERCFTPDPAFEFLPAHAQKLLGYQYTDEHIWTLKLPFELIGKDNITIKVIPRASKWFDKDDAVLDITHSDGQQAQYPLAGCGRIISIYSEDEQKSNGVVMIARMERPIRKDEADDYMKTIFADDLQAVYDEKERQRQADLKREEEAEAQRAEDERLRLERRRKVKKSAITLSKIVGAIAAAVVIAVFATSQIQKLIYDYNLRRAAHAVEVELQTTGFIELSAVRLEAIKQAKMRRTQAIETAKDERLDQIRTAKIRRQQQIATAKDERLDQIATAEIRRQRQIENAQSARRLKIVAAMRTQQDRLNEAIKQRENKINTAKQARRKEISDAKRQRQVQQDRIERDRNLLHAAIVNRENRIAEFHRKKSAIIENGETQRKQALMSALDERLRKIDDVELRQTRELAAPLKQAKDCRTHA